MDNVVREAFEREAKRSGRFDLQRDASDPDRYWSAPTEHAWAGFQLAWQSQQAQGEDIEPTGRGWREAAADELQDLFLDRPSDEYPTWESIYRILSKFAPSDPSAVPEGYTFVPDSALRWLFGEEGEFEPPEDMLNWHMRVYGGLGSYWWRTVFRNMIAAASLETPDKDLEQTKLFEQALKSSGPSTTAVDDQHTIHPEDQ